MFLKSVFSLIMLLMLAACQPTQHSASAANASKSTTSGMVTVSVDAVNYMHDWDVVFTVFDPRTKLPIANGILGLLEGPGGKNCCISLPAHWQPDMKLKVEWQLGGKDTMAPEKYQRELTIPRYAEPGDLYVLFHPDNEVELVVSRFEPSHPEWRGKVKGDAFSACVARLSDKECRKHLPKYRHGSPDFAAERMREGCQEGAIVYSDDPEIIKLNREACESMQKECLTTWAVTDKAMCSPSYKEQ